MAINMNREPPWWTEACDRHPTWREASIDECLQCGYAMCPYGEPLHWHHDGCPCCIYEGVKFQEYMYGDPED